MNAFIAESSAWQIRHAAQDILGEATAAIAAAKCNPPAAEEIATRAAAMRRHATMIEREAAALLAAVKPSSEAA